MSWTPPTSLDVSLPFELAFEDRVLSRVIERWAQHDGDRICLEQDDGETLTYGQLDERASAVAHGLRDLGIGFGDRVATLVGNDLRAISLGVALSKIGAVEVPINPMLVGASLTHVLADSGPAAIVVAPGFVEAVTEAWSGDRSPTLLTMAPSDGAPAGGDGPSIDAMLGRPAAAFPTHELVLPSASAAIMYTSGTTGLPKGALLPHGHCYRIMERSAGAFGLTEADTFISVLPLFHAGGRYMNVGACLLAGARCGFVRKFSGTAFFDQARAFGATVMHGIVSVGLFLLAQDASPLDREHTITRAMLVPASPAFAEEFTERFGIEVFQAYGSTESNLAVFNLDAPPGAAGRVYPPYRVRIVDEHDRDVPRGEVGEIVVSCDEPWSTFSGYWNQPERSLEALRNFGVHTGDAATMDADGVVWFVDRIKDMIRRRGENVAAATVEGAVQGIEAVAECAAYPLPSEFGEEEIAIAITPKPGRELTAEEVVASCREALPRFALPRYVRFLDELPKTETGKIQKFKLKELGIDGAHDVPEVRR